MLAFFDLLSALIIFGFPLFFLAHKNFPLFPRSLLGKFVLTVFLVWIFSILLRGFSLPYRIRAAEERGDLLHDGVAANAAIFFGGWLFGIIGSIPALIIRAIVSAFQSRQPTSNPDLPHPPQDPANPYAPPASPQEDPVKN